MRRNRVHTEEVTRQRLEGVPQWAPLIEAELKDDG
jgi:hypothetical protein